MFVQYKPTSLLSTSLGFCILRVVVFLWGPLDQNFNNNSLIMSSLPTYKKVQATNGEIHLNYFCTCTKKIPDRKFIKCCMLNLKQANLASPQVMSIRVLPACHVEV